MKYKTIKIDINKTNVFFTSDTHFMHENIIKYCNRPFDKVEEMNRIMAQNWTSIVKEEDIVFHLGDFCFGGMKEWKYLLHSLPGKIYLSAGNHDKSITPYMFMDVKQMYNILIEGDEEIKDGQRITLCHYPMLSWYQSHRGAWQLYGHVHGVLRDDPRLSPNQLDVGVDVHNFAPISYRQVKTIITKQNLK